MLNKLDFRFSALLLNFVGAAGDRCITLAVVDAFRPEVAAEHVDQRDNL